MQKELHYHKMLWAHPIHKPTKEQLDSIKGELVYLTDINPELAKKLEQSPDTTGELQAIAKEVSKVLFDNHCDCIIQPGGSIPQVALIVYDYYENMVYAFSHSPRVTTEVVKEDGSIEKVSTFKHQGWIVI